MNLMRAVRLFRLHFYKARIARLQQQIDQLGADLGVVVRKKAALESKIHHNE
jgi:hypothetical protein